MKKIILLFLVSIQLFGLEYKIQLNKYNDIELNKSVEQIASIFNNGEKVSFKQRNQNWYDANNIKLKEDNKGFILLYDDNKFFKETEDKLLTFDSKTKFKINEDSVESLKSSIKEESDKFILSYFPKGDYEFVKVGLTTSGLADEEGNITEYIDMLSVVYGKKPGNIKAIGKGTFSRVYFKPSGEIIGVKISKLNPKTELTRSDFEFLDNNTRDIDSYLDRITENVSKKFVEYRYIQKGDELELNYLIFIQKPHSKKQVFTIPVSEYNGFDSIEKIMNDRNSETVEEDNK